MTSSAQPVSGQDINLAARASRQALDVLLAEQGTSFAPCATLNTIVALGASLDREALVRHLGAGLDVDAATVRAVLHGLQARRLVALSDEHYVLTAEGKAEHQRLSQPVAALTAELYGGLDADELAATRRVLVALTERASAHVQASIGATTSAGRTTTSGRALPSTSDS
jgi:DNA-binding MarR family transcriptional regulator